MRISDWSSDVCSSDLSSFCNAGFDLFGEFRSLTGYVDDLAVNLTISGLIIIGGIGFGVLADIWENRKFSGLSLHTKVVLITSSLLIFFGTLDRKSVV